MRRGSKGSLGHRGGEAYGGHNGQDINDNKLEPVIKENEDYPYGMDNPQDLWDPDDDPSEWVVNQDEDDELK